MKHSSKVLSLLLMVLLSMTIFVTSCNDDEEPPEEEGMMASLENLTNLVNQANALIDGATEGFELGQFQFGSIAILQDVVDASQIVLDSPAPDPAVVANAETLLTNAIAAFEATEVTSVATPWVQQTVGNRIEITDSNNGTNRGVLALIESGRDFTIEFNFQPISLQNLGFANTLLSAGKQFDSDGSGIRDNGFHIRYHADGSLEYIIGAQDASWMQSATAPEGTIVAEEWQHIAYSHSGADQILYVNGVEILRTSFPYTSIGDITTVDGFLIGGPYDWPDRVANALVQDVRVWSVALPAQDLNDQSITGTGEGLEAWFPMRSDQGQSFMDVSGNYQAVFADLVRWAPDGDITRVPIDYTALDNAIAAANDFVASVNEGPNVGDFGIGTRAFVQARIDAGSAISGSGTQSEAVDATTVIESAVALVQNNLVTETGSANGLSYDVNDPATIGFQIFTIDGSFATLPEGDYTIEVEVNLNDFTHPNGTETSILGTANLQFRMQTNNDNAGAIEHFVQNNGWFCACSPAGTMVAGEWVNLAVVYNSGSGISTIYLNGNEVASGSTPSFLQDQGWDHFWLGNRAGAGNILNGSARDLRVWSTARNVSDLNGEINGDESNLELYFPLDSRSAPLFADETGNFFGSIRGVSYNDN